MSAAGRASGPANPDTASGGRGLRPWTRAAPGCPHRPAHAAHRRQPDRPRQVQAVRPAVALRLDLADAARQGRARGTGCHSSNGELPRQVIVPGPSLGRHRAVKTTTTIDHCRRMLTAGTAGQHYGQHPEQVVDGRVDLYAGFCRPAEAGWRPSISACRRRQAPAAYPQARAGSPRTPAQAVARGRPTLLALLRVGFTEPRRSPGALVGSYPTVSPLPGRSLAVCFLWHCPAGHPGLPLTTTLPYGVRTFLGGGPKRTSDAAARSTRPSHSV
jgi:hypothetical protein